MQKVISVEWLGWGCATRCSHCYLSAGERTSPNVPYDRARDIAQRFVSWSHSAEDPETVVDFTAGTSYEAPMEQILDYLRFCRAATMVGWDYLPLNGLRLRTRAELIEFLGTLATEGLRTVNLTFYGYGASHDMFARRRGDFEYLMLMAHVMAELGLARSETLLLRKPTLGELDRLMLELDEIPGRAQRLPSILEYLGRGANLESERLDTRDLTALPAGLRERLSPVKNRSEADWVRAVKDGDIPPRRKAVYVIPVCDENAGYLERTPCDVVVRELESREEARRQPIPSLPELAGQWGDPAGSRIYLLEDLEVKWSSAFIADQDPDSVRDWLDPSASRIRTRY